MGEGPSSRRNGSGGGNRQGESDVSCGKSWNCPETEMCPVNNGKTNENDEIFEKIDKILARCDGNPKRKISVF